MPMAADAPDAEATDAMDATDATGTTDTVTAADAATALVDPVSFFKLVTGFDPYPDQMRKLSDPKRVIVDISGRQTGKSLTWGVRAMWHTLLQGGLAVVVSRTEQHAMEFFRKSVLHALELQEDLKGLVRRQTLKMVEWDNSGRILCIPSRPESVRSYTPDLLIIDEAAYVDDAVFVAARPALVKSRGTLIVSSTPFGKRGKAYQYYRSERSSVYNTPVTECPGISEEELKGLRDDPTMTELEWRQEYLAQFIDEAEQYIPHELLLRCQRLSVDEWHDAGLDGWEYKIGVDVARGGRDETVYCVMGADVEGDGDEIPRVVAYHAHSKRSVTHTAGRCKELSDVYNGAEVGVDAMGVGAGVYDILEEDGYPVVDCTFSGKYKDRVYKRLKTQMDLGRVGLLDERAVMVDGEVDAERERHVRKMVYQFLDLAYEYTKDGLLRVGKDVSRSQRQSGDRVLDDYPDATVMAFDLWDGGGWGFSQIFTGDDLGTSATGHASMLPAGLGGLDDGLL